MKKLNEKENQMSELVEKFNVLEVENQEMKAKYLELFKKIKSLTQNCFKNYDLLQDFKRNELIM